jgi:hypothetical protein
MKLIKLVKVDDNLVEDLTLLYPLLSVGGEVVIPYEEEWELDMKEMKLDYIIVEV